MHHLVEMSFGNAVMLRDFGNRHQPICCQSKVDQRAQRVVRIIRQSQTLSSSTSPAIEDRRTVCRRSIGPARTTRQVLPAIPVHRPSVKLHKVYGRSCFWRQRCQRYMRHRPTRQGVTAMRAYGCCPFSAARWPAHKPDTIYAGKHGAINLMLTGGLRKCRAGRYRDNRPAFYARAARHPWTSVRSACRNRDSDRDRSSRYAREAAGSWAATRNFRRHAVQTAPRAVRTA